MNSASSLKKHAEDTPQRIADKIAKEILDKAQIATFAAADGGRMNVLVKLTNFYSANGFCENYEGYHAVEGTEVENNSLVVAVIMERLAKLGFTASIEPDYAETADNRTHWVSEERLEQMKKQSEGQACDFYVNGLLYIDWSEPTVPEQF